jgi:uncharacterized surface protein with fasciclin (FAS1) repeats
MKRLLLAGALALATAGCGGAGEQADNTAAERNAAMSGQAPSGTIAEGLGNSRFAAALQAAGLDATLKGAGPYTVLAPSDEAFANLPAESLEALNRPEGKDRLTRLLSNHVLPGTMLAADIGKAIERGNGKAVLATMAGGTLTATRPGDRIVLTSEDGLRATLSGAERNFSNGVLHPIDTVLAPAG